MAKRGVGRPSSITAEAIEAIEKHISAGATITQAAVLSNVPPSTLKLWRVHAEQGKGGPLHQALLAAIRRAQVKAEMRATAALVKAAADDWKAAAWWLCHSPATRDHWSDAGALRQAKASARAELMERVLMAIEVAVREPEQRGLLLESLRFHGCLKGIEDGKP